VDPLRLSGKLDEHIIGRRSKTLELLTAQTADIRYVPFDQKAFHCLVFPLPRGVRIVWQQVRMIFDHAASLLTPRFRQRIHEPRKETFALFYL
jgi:hypothetical protein